MNNAGVELIVQTYYYNARTRESAWSKPDNAKIITQAEMEAMAASGQPLPGSSAGGNQSGQTSASHTPSSQGTNVVVISDISHYTYYQVYFISK